MKTKKPKVIEKRKIKQKAFQTKRSRVKADKEIDPIRIGRVAHARVFDQPVKLGTGSDRVNAARDSLNEFILAGNAIGFISWLDERYPDWQRDTYIIYFAGMAYKFAREYSLARRFLEAALENFRNAASSALIELSAVALGADADHDAAWAHLDAAAQLTPNFWMVYYDSLALASVERDNRRLESIFERLTEKIPNWFEEKQIVDLFLSDGELAYLREESPLWKRINNQIERRQS